MGTAIAIFLILVGLLMVGIGIWSYLESRKPQQQLPLLFRWAQGANQTGGVIFAVIMVVAGLLIGGVGVRFIL